MVKVYYYDNIEGEPWLPHEGEPAPISALTELGVVVANFEDRTEVERFAEEKGYKNKDEVTLSPETFGEKYQPAVDGFWEEHLHVDEEIRYILGGHGFEDFRDKNQRWIRCALSKGDFFILPVGVYHRFHPGADKFTHAIRWFKDLPEWKAYYRKDEPHEKFLKIDRDESGENIAVGGKAHNG